LRKYGFWKDLTFYFLIEAYADVILRASMEFQALRQAPAPSAEKLQGLVELRTEADEAYGQFLQRLENTFITPLDKEDLLEIVQKLEMVLEAIERAARGLPLVPEAGASPHVAALAAKLQEAVQAAFELASALRHGYKHQALPPNLAALQRIRKESDLLHDAAVKDLGAGALPPQAVVTCKEAYDRLLAVPERSADLAQLVARLLVKYA